MAVTATAKTVADNLQKTDVFQFCHITLSGTYLTGGFSFADLFDKIDEPKIVIPIGDTGGYVVVQDRSARKLKIYYGDNNNASDGALVEIPNATDIGAIAALADIFCLVIGK